MNASYLIGLAVKIFLLLTPFFVLSVFVSTCSDMDHAARKNPHCKGKGLADK